MAQPTKLSKSQGKSPRRTWSQKFLELAGSAPDFPYPQEPPPIDSEEGMNLERKLNPQNE